MKYLIPFDDKYEFVFLEEPANKNTHPVSNYFLKLNDLSINLLINLKWIVWGYEFLTLTSKNLKKQNKNEILSKNVLNQLKSSENKDHIF